MMLKTMVPFLKTIISSWVLGVFLNFTDGDEIKVLPETVILGSSVSLQCNDNSSLNRVEWYFNGEEIQPNDVYHFDSEQQLVLYFNSAVYEHSGLYNCFYQDEDSFINKSANVVVYGRPVLLNYSDSTVNLKKKSLLECLYYGNPLPSISWNLPKKGLSHEIILNNISNTMISSKLFVKSVKKAHNGTYDCIAINDYGSAVKSVSLKVQYTPVIHFDHVLGVDKTRVFMNWTIDKGNADIKEYFVQYMKEQINEWAYTSTSPSPETNRFIIDNLDSMSIYQFRISASNKIGRGDYSNSSGITTLSKDPVYKPELSITGNAPNSITVAWSLPPKHIQLYIQYFTLEKIDQEKSYQVIVPANDQPYYLWTDLSPGKLYSFQIQACCEYTDECGPFSDITNGTTMDGESGPPTNVLIKCQLDNVSLVGLLSITWSPPIEPNGKIISYQVQVGGEAHYINEQGSEEMMTEGPTTHVVDSSRTQVHLTVTPNTNYSVQLCAVTRLEKCGTNSDISVSSQCIMPPSVPSNMPDLYWRKWNNDDSLMYILHVPRISERKGPICCYRIIMIKLQPGQDIIELPPPENITLQTYEEVHLEGRSGAYVADMFENHNFQRKVILGDGELSAETPQCLACFPEKLTFDSSLWKRKKPTRRRRYTTIQSSGIRGVEDGSLDPNTNYTGFIEIRVMGPEEQVLLQYSNYFSSVQELAENTAVDPYQVLTIHLGVILGLLLVVLILLVAVIFLQKYSKQMAEEQGVEMTFRNSIRYFWQSLRGRQPGFPMSQEPPDVAPILEDALVEAFKSKHKDSDLGFRHEFDQLPEGFCDRTTEATDSLDNAIKNRYPDIKAYDQTRVKLTQLNGIIQSDYINANYVMGYKERKKFICAQGPLESTLPDFWRMIWEQRVDIIVMLTNFEENGRMKCVPYWDSDMPMDVGDVTISCSAEKRYSDYILRRLKAERKRNGEDAQVREISHFHYLVWKDFMAPEHPFGILKFIRRVNEVYSPEKGPILIHCSAGVGRTGTYVAIDSLLQELENEKTVSIFNTICDLRHQRNYLVQSLKQYIFVYRALMEMAQFGYTEVIVEDFDSHWQQLHIEADGCTQIQKMFESLSRVIEDRKALNVGSSEVNSSKNRYDSIIPYDQNRVILIPTPTCIEANYINASFIQGYDHSLSYIIAQDPIESTKLDFWRMILNQNVSFIVMLSEDGEDEALCPQYWPDQAEKQIDHISIILESLTTMPDYIRRELSVTNTKTKDIHRVTQLQYLGWAGESGQLPTTTSTILSLSELAIKYLENSYQSPVLVHCSGGSDRSSIFVAVCILLQQIKNENRVDVFQTVRNIRSQRLCMIQTLDHFKFCYQAVYDYLHKSKSLSVSSSTPSTSTPSTTSLSS